MTREVELKLDVDPPSLDAVRHSTALAGLEASAHAQLARYYDTPTGSLSRAGFSLRIRRSGDRHVQTLKLGKKGSAGLFDRQEWEWDVPSLKVDLAVLHDTAAGPLLKRNARLERLFEVETERTSWKEEGIAVTLDEGSLRTDTSETGISELEFEADGAAPDALFALARTIGREAALRLGVLSKAERGQRLADGRIGRIAKAEPVALPEDPTVAQGFSAIANNCLRHYRLNEMVLLDRPDPNALHQARVAMRRLRSSFSFFGNVIRDAEYERLREEVRWFTAKLGPVRNLDVMLKRLPAKMKREEKAVRAALEQAREEAYATAWDAINSQRHRALMLDLLEWLALGSWRGTRKAAAPLTAFAAKRLDRRWRKVRDAGRALDALDAEPRHRLRIDIKKMRYAAEFLADIHRDEGIAGRRKAFLGALEELQEQLGHLNDTATGQDIAGTLSLSVNQQEIVHRLTARAYDEAECLAAAGQAYRQLREAGPYWRS